ncbi:insulin-induced gene 1 protein isoform X2 [Brachyhypopomus gauderio]
MPRLEERCWSCSCSTAVKTKELSSASWIASKTGETMSIISSVLSQAYGSLHHVQSASLIRRGLVLFAVGVFLALVLYLLQIQRNVVLFPDEVLNTLFSSAWWIPLCCGTAAAVVGLLYPYLDSHLGEPHKFKREWASVMRCIAVFVGINHASAHPMSPPQLACVVSLRYTSPELRYVRSWLPCIFFSGGVTVGNIGRQLAMGSSEKPHSD